jgi:hypothetical protein
MVVFGSLAFAGLASAAITPALVGSPTASGANFKWTYQISVDSLEQLVTGSGTPCTLPVNCGSFFTIYDFVGYVPGSVKAPAGWTAQVADTGLTPSTQIPPDNATISNLTFVYTGTTSPDVGPINLSGFSALSTYGTASNGGTFTYKAEKLNGTVDGGIGPIAIPSSSCATDVFEVNYFSNANTSFPDGTVQITNVGASIGATGDKSGDLCALIYVLRPDQQLAECCSCAVTPDGLLTLSINANLTANPLTAAALNTGDIKIISSTSCDPTAPAPAPGIRAWATHIQTKTQQTETAFSTPNLCSGELESLATQCAIVTKEGSGAGTCMCGGGAPE